MNRRSLLKGAVASSLATRSGSAASIFPNIPPDYLREPDDIPPFWISTPPEINKFLEARVKKGRVAPIGKTAGGRPIQAVFYGTPRNGKGTTTFSGSLGFRDVRAYIGPDYEKRVFIAMAGVHGGEFEGMVGMVNFVSVLETGKDLRGVEWPEITAVAQKLDRLIIIPVVNVDGRTRVPLRMVRHRGSDYTVHEYFNTGAKPDGSLIGWPQCKQFIPLDFSKTQFPGGYPNDAGVNIQHDDFFGSTQPETRALFRLTAEERPDLMLNMHTGASFLQPLRPFVEPVLMPVYEEMYRRVRGRLAEVGLQASADAALEGDPKRERLSVFNLDSALNMHCGVLPILVESPSHNFSTSKKRNGERFVHSPEDLLKAQLTCYQESMKLLVETGGRVRWTTKSS
jgi:hypothetical protein